MKTIQVFFKSTVRFQFIITLLLVTLITGCSKDDDSAIQETELSNENKITSFIFLLTNNPIDVNVIATIDNENKTISAFVPPGTNVNGLLPEIEVSPNAQINTQIAQDFTNPVSYTVTAEDGTTATYVVSVSVALSQREILQTILDANPNHTIDWDLETTENLGDLTGVTTNLEGTITKLLLNDKNLTMFPPEIGQLSNLTYLTLSTNNLNSISSEIGQLTNLKVLGISNLQLNSIPSEVLQITSLEKLYFKGNNLSNIPPEIGQLTSLEELHLNNNNLSSIPPEIGQLTSLTVLKLFSNQLTSLPPEIGQLTSLTSLGLGSNQIATISSEIEFLTNLEFLHLNNNQLSTLPLEIWQLTSLISLGLNTNQLSTLPSEIGQLTNLIELRLFDNQLNTLPPEIGFLTNLNVLEIQDNNLSVVPSAICNLKIYNNPTMNFINDAPCFTVSQIDALIAIYSANPGNTLGWGVDNFPEVVFNENDKPVAITMNNKNLTRIPDVFDLVNLKSFNVNNNNLESLPESLWNLDDLETITAAGNILNTVPSSLGFLSNLTLLSLTNNPITSIPQEVCDLQVSNGGILTILTDPGEECN